MVLLSCREAVGTIIADIMPSVIGFIQDFQNPDVDRQGLTTVLFHVRNEKRSED
jgi:hypothetical protein